MEPEYGYMREGREYFPTQGELFKALIRSFNVFSSRKRWINAFSLAVHLTFFAAAIRFFLYFFSFRSLLLGFLIATVLETIPAEAILHRGFSHQAFRPRNRFCHFLIGLLAPVYMPVELFVVAHLAHHQLSDRAADPYNARGGLLYCYFTDYLHQHINPDLSEAEYERLKRMLGHCMLRQNSYEQYRRWGTIAHPAFFIPYFFLCAFVHASVVIGLFGYAVFMGYIAGMVITWLALLRPENYFIHAKGKARHRDGVEFHRSDLSYNHPVCTWVIGQRHNYHHHYPASANTAFLKGQLDQSFAYIRLLGALGLVVDIKDSRREFLRDHWEPFRRTLNRVVRS